MDEKEKRLLLGEEERRRYVPYQAFLFFEVSLVHLLGPCLRHHNPIRLLLNNIYWVRAPFCWLQSCNQDHFPLL